MKYSCFIFFLVCVVCTASAQPSAMYRIELTDKGSTPYSIERPEEFLSQKSIERRIKQGFAVDETDLPIHPAYFQALVDAGAGIRASSKWVNTVTVSIPDDNVLAQVELLPFVKNITKVWAGNLSGANPVPADKPALAGGHTSYTGDSFQPADYGDALTQIRLNNALPLHEQGYKGSGITIAVMDAGFRNVDLYPGVFNPAKILGVKNFTHEQEELYRSAVQHGTYVLSCLLADTAGAMIGTAPEAAFYLFKTEVNNEEYPVEEDYWVAALEYADSLGVDIVSTSLGYTFFDDDTMNHSWDDLDGYTIPASRAASMAAYKGMALFIAAGNEGNRLWEKASIPSDATNILAVGAVDRDSLRATFSAHGCMADERIKPDVMAVGQQACVFNSNGYVTTSGGTSFATPVLAGMGACLWEALPHLTSLELIQWIKKNSDRYDHPDCYYGYGIPNIAKALNSASSAIGSPIAGKENTQSLYLDSVNNRLCFNYGEVDRWIIYSYTGNKIFENKTPINNLNISFLPNGVYIALISSSGKYYVKKFIIHN